MSTAKEQEIDETKQTTDDNIEQTNEIENSDESHKTISEEKEEKKKEKGSFLKEFLIYLCIFIVLWRVIPAYVIERTIVDGTSMQNTLQDEEQLMVERLSYQFSDPKRRWDC